MAALDAVKLGDTYDSTGRRWTAADEVINETINGNARLGALTTDADLATAEMWEAVARDLAQQVINAEAEIAELDEKAEFGESWLEVASESADLGARLRDEEQAHCDTYLEAVRLTNELNGWQNSEGAEYRKATAAARLEQYRQSPAYRNQPHP